MIKRLIKYSSVMFVATIIANLFSYLFHVYMGRTLGPGDYGMLGSLLAAFYILSVPLEAISTTMTKFVSEFKAKNEYGKIASLFFSSTRKLSRYGIITFVVMSLSSWLIADFLKIPSHIPIILMGILVVFSVLLSISRGVLRGLQNFNRLGLNLILEALMRLLCGVLLVSIGLGVYGALLSYGLAYFLAFLLILVSLRFLWAKKPASIDVPAVYKFSFPTLIMFTCLMVMTNIDLLLVKHFFISEKAGIYTAVSVLGKVILFVSGAFAATMFPIASELNARKGDASLILKKSLTYVALASGIILTAYWLFPTTIIGIVYGSQYLAASHLLGLFGTASGLMSLIVVYTRFRLATKDMQFIKILIFSTFLEIVLFAIFHQTLLQIVYVLISTNIVTLSLLTVGRLKIKGS